MSWFAYALVTGAAALVGYAFVGYPLALRIASGRRGELGWNRMDPGESPSNPEEWPTLSITVPAHNEEAQIRETVESLLAADYPEDRRQILLVSDGSTDETDRIVSEYEDRGVELLRMSERVGKSAARFSDPTVGVASGQDVSVERGSTSRNRGEAGYVGYEMWVRDLETWRPGPVASSAPRALSTPFVEGSTTWRSRSI